MGAADTKTTLTWVLKDEVSGAAKGIGSSIGGLINPTTLAIGGIAALTAGIGASISAAAEAQKINAQTAAAIKSTGGAAGLTSEQIQDLASSISEYSGIDDSAVQSGENLLLTFTNIQDKAGEGNDIFTQATTIMADMATAMGTDMSSQAIQLGKALNDPVAGIGALSRVGVTFTQEQKDMIKAMVEAGDTAGAQRVIMAELTKEFGGSAEAAGSTADGAFKRLENAMGEIFEKVGTALLPILTDLAEFAIEELIPAIEDFAEVVGPVLSAAFTLIGGTIGWFVDNIIKPAINFISSLIQFVKDAIGFLQQLAGIPSPAGPDRKRAGTPGRQHGGPVYAGESYTVGESGPETLVMGSRSGMVIPGVAPSGGGGVPVEIPVMLDGHELGRLIDRRLYILLSGAGGSAANR